jgi:hypothetical protein
LSTREERLAEKRASFARDENLEQSSLTAAERHEKVSSCYVFANKGRLRLHNGEGEGKLPLLTIAFPSALQLKALGQDSYLQSQAVQNVASLLDLFVLSIRSCSSTSV